MIGESYQNTSRTTCLDRTFSTNDAALTTPPQYFKYLADREFLKPAFEVNGIPIDADKSKQ